MLNTILNECEVRELYPDLLFINIDFEIEAINLCICTRVIMSDIFLSFVPRHIPIGKFNNLVLNKNIAKMNILTIFVQCSIG